MIQQKTIGNKISCSGIGLHSGLKVSATLIPAPCNSGIIFKRTDVEEAKSVIQAKYSNVIETNLGTVIANEFGVKVSTIEHLMAAIWGCGIDNLIVEIDAPEAPIMDGSSAPFVFLLECAGVKIQEEIRNVIEITQNFEFEEDGKKIEIEPAKEFSFDLKIDFQHKKIQQQQVEYHSTFSSFKNDLCRARTFGFKSEIEYLRKIGLVQGGSLDNAILIDEEDIVNEGGLRYANEFARHKAIDFIGDLYLAGHYIIGHFKASKSGHYINNKMLRKLLADQSCWRIVPAW